MIIALSRGVIRCCNYVWIQKAGEGKEVVFGNGVYTVSSFFK